MGVIGALRTLWRFRIAMIVIGVLAIAVGFAVALKSKQYHVALGTATALVDSPSSQVVDLGGVEFSAVNLGSLSGRANLLASVMTQSPIKDEIAARAGLSPGQLIAVSPVVAADGAGGASGGATQAKITDPSAFVLRAAVPTLESGQVPMLSVQTQAPVPAQASKLANAAIEVLQQHLEDVAGKDGVPADRRVVIRQLGPAAADLQVRGQGKKLAVGAAILVFVLGCGTILLLVALARAWRAASEYEQMQAAVAFEGHVTGTGTETGTAATRRTRSSRYRTPSALTCPYRRARAMRWRTRRWTSPRRGRTGPAAEAAGAGMHLPRRFPRRLSVPGALAISTLVGLFFAVNSVYSISLAPPKLQPRTVSVALAATHVMVDAPQSLITNPKATAGDFETYSKRATLYSNLLDSPPVRQMIARRAGIPVDQLTTRSRLTAIGAGVDARPRLRGAGQPAAGRPASLQARVPGRSHPPDPQHLRAGAVGGGGRAARQRGGRRA